jgi:SRSO17 transposase
MTDRDISRLGPAFSSYLGRYRDCFLQDRIVGHFDDYCRGLLSDLPRKTVEPIALVCGTAVRTLQEFLVTASWDHDLARDTLQRHIAKVIGTLPADPLGTVGVIDETSCVKKGGKTPGVQRQYLGCVGKIDNGIVTVHVGVAHGRFQTLLDADLYLPQSWDEDRPRCQAAGIPDDVHYLPKWQIALDQYLRLHGNGVRFDWLTFDEGYGSKTPFLGVLSMVRQKFVAEVPVNFAVRMDEAGPSRRADEVFTAEDAKGGRRFRFRRETQAAQWWRAKSVSVRVDGRAYRLVVAINQATAEVKYFVTNAVGEPLRRVLAVAFRRATVEHCFRVGKREAGLMHYEGRQYTGLMRHLILSLIVMGFVSVHTDRLRGEKSTGDEGAGMPGVERALRNLVSPEAGDIGDESCGRGNPLSPAPQRAGRTRSQEAAA